MLTRLIAVTLVLLAAVDAQPAALNVSVTCDTAAGFLPFWRSAGYTPAEFALRPDEVENGAWIGSLPRRGIEQGEGYGDASRRSTSRPAGVHAMASRSHHPSLPSIHVL